MINLVVFLVLLPIVGLAKDTPVLELRVSHPGLRLSLLNFESYLQLQVGGLKKTVYTNKCNQKDFENLFTRIKTQHSSTPVIALPAKPSKKASKNLLKSYYPVKFANKTQLIPRTSRFGKLIDSLTNEVLFLEQKGKSCE